MTAPQDAPNQSQAQYWNAANGDTWVRLQQLLDGLFAPVGEGVVEAGFPGEGGAVLDIGCGAGATTLAMARRMGRGGRCLGADLSGPLVEAARARAATEGADGVSFVVADAQTHAFEPKAFDAAISRFGVMFFDDPIAAFGNIRRAVRPGGRLAFAAWRAPDENPFMTAGARVARSYQPDMPRYVPDAPGQFGLARAARIEAVLSAAGWSGVEARAWNAPGVLPQVDLMAFVTQLGPVGAVLRALPQAEQAEATEKVLAAYTPFIRDGAAHFDMACWLVTARI